MPQDEFWERINKETEIFYNLKPMSEYEGHTVSTVLEKTCLRMIRKFWQFEAYEQI